MIALIWKELRENLKWALPAMAVLGGAEYFALTGEGSGQTGYYNHGITLCSESFLTLTLFGCAAIGFLLGLIQIVPELGRDRWAALRHLPVTRGTLLGAKALAGLLLYALAAGLPLFFSIWWAAAPGHFSAPFVPGMVRPGVADLCTGVAYYFAGLTLALHRGGWSGLRCLPLLAAVHLSFFTLDTHFCRVAVEAAAAMAAVLFVSGWGAMLDASLLRNRPGLTRLAFWLVAFYGMCGAGDLAYSFLKTVQISPGSKWVGYQFSAEGVPFRITQKENAIVAVEGLDGTVPTDPNDRPDRFNNHQMFLNGVASHIGNDHGRPPEPRWYNYRETNSYLWALGVYEYPHLEEWFSLVEERKVIGYRLQEKKAIGRLDWRGFLPAGARSEPYPSDAKFSNSSAEFGYLWNPDRILFVSLPKQQSLEASLPAAGPVYGVQGEWARTAGGSVNLVAVALGTGIAAYDKNGNLVAMLPYHRDVDRWGRVELGMNGALDRFYLHYAPSDWIDGRTAATMPSYFEEMDAKGNVLHAYVLPPLPHFPPVRPWRDYIRDGLGSPAFYFGQMAYWKIGAELGSQRLQRTLKWQWITDRPRTIQVSVTISILSLACSLAALFWARRIQLSWPRALAWAGFVLALNAAGLILFRLASDWPVLVRCPHCPETRPPEAEACPHCGGDWPAPMESGTEIFHRPVADASV